MTGPIATINPPYAQRNPNPPGTGARRPGDDSHITVTKLDGSASVSALADLNTGRPTITAGGAKWTTVDRPQLAGLSVFTGYDPLTLNVPLLFDDYVAGNSVEDDLDMLWNMWGRGVRAANASKKKQPSPLTVDGALLPRMIRYGSANPAPPNWVITNISEDAASALHNSAHHVVRLAVVVTLGEYNTSSALDSLTGDDDTSTPRTKTNVYPAGTTMRQIQTRQRTTVKKLRALNNYGSNEKLDKYLRDPSKRFAKALAVKVPRVPA